MTIARSDLGEEAYASSYVRYQQSYPDFSLYLREARQRAVTAKAALKGTHPRKVRHQIYRFLNSPDVKLASFFRAVRKKGLLDQYPPERIQQVSSTLNCYAGSAEQFHLFERRDVWGKTRIIHSFGPERHALQSMADAVLEATHKLREDQYVLAGGLPAALRAVEAAYRDGYEYGQIVDAVNFYPSIRCDGLVSLLKPLPRSTVQNVIWTRDGSYAPNAGHLTAAVQRERPNLRGQPFISQGSASSSFVGELVMKHILDALPDEARNSAYADDVFIHGRTEEEVVMNVNLLQRAADQHPAGPLRLRTDGVFRLDQPFEYLGHEGLPTENKTISWKPSDQNLSRYQQLIENGTAPISDLLSAISRLPHFRRAFYQWDHGTPWTVRTETELWARYAYKTNDRISLALAARRILTCQQTNGISICFDDELPEPCNQREWQRRQSLWGKLELHHGAGGSPVA